MSGGGERPYPAPNYAVFEAAADVPAPPRLSPSSFLLRPKAVPAFPGEEEEAGDEEAVRTRACVRGRAGGGQTHVHVEGWLK